MENSFMNMQIEFEVIVTHTLDIIKGTVTKKSKNVVFSKLQGFRATSNFFLFELKLYEGCFYVIWNNFEG